MPQSAVQRGFRGFDALRSVWTWSAVVFLIIIWLPLLALIRLFDRDPVHYRTGRWFRRLGVAMTKVNPAWRLRVSGYTVTDARNPYVVVSNHLSMADIPLIAHLPWEMKWIGKEVLFRLPLIGWMMKMAGDMPVDRGNVRSGARVLLRAAKVLQQKCSVIFFPEGTRSLDGRLGRFNDGAFHLAIRSQVPILPLVIDGSQNCLPKKSWIFGRGQTIQLKVMEPVATAGMVAEQVGELRDAVRGSILRQLSEWRSAPRESVDALATTSPAAVIPH